MNTRANFYIIMFLAITYFSIFLLNFQQYQVNILSYGLSILNLWNKEFCLAYIITYGGKFIKTKQAKKV